MRGSRSASWSPTCSAVGEHHYGRIDLHIPEEMKQGAIQRARAEATQTLGKYKVIQKEGLDGIKFFLDAPTNGNGACNHGIPFRASGTEPLLRLYAEAASPELTKEILATAEEFVAHIVERVGSGGPGHGAKSDW